MRLSMLYIPSRICPAMSRHKPPFLPLPLPPLFLLDLDTRTSFKPESILPLARLSNQESDPSMSTTIALLGSIHIMQEVTGK